VSVGENVVPGFASHTFVVPASGMPTASVHGVVLDPERQPRQGVVLWLRRTDQQQSRGSWGETGADGAFLFGPLLPGPYELEVRADDFAAVPPQSFTLVAQESRDLGRLDLHRGTRLFVRVLDQDGAPWPHKLPTVLLETTAADGTWDQRGGFVAKAGLLRSPPLRPGHRRLVVRDENLFSRPLEVDVVDGQDTTVDLRLQPGAVRHFRVEGLAASAHLWVEAIDGSGRVVRHVCREIGGYGAIGLQLALLPGSWTVMAWDHHGNRWHAALEVTDLEPRGFWDAVPMQR
jgi:hypothetical protein